MELTLTKKPKNPIIIEGSPGFGYVGAISVEFLIKHLKTEVIGRIEIEDLKPVVLLQDSEIVKPFEILYNKQYNIVFVRALVDVPNKEVNIAEKIIELASILNAKSIISIDGVSSGMPTTEEKQDMKVFFNTNNSTFEKKLKSAGLEKLTDGIVMGISGGLLMKAEKTNLISLFAETRSNMPDRHAAAEVIKVLDKYVGLKVDYKPLLEEAKKYEAQIKKMLSQATKAVETKQKKDISYLG